MYVHVYVHVYVFMCVHVCASVCTCVHVAARVCMRVRMRLRIYVCTYVRTYVFLSVAVVDRYIAVSLSLQRSPECPFVGRPILCESTVQTIIVSGGMLNKTFDP